MPLHVAFDAQLHGCASCIIFIMIFFLKDIEITSITYSGDPAAPFAVAFYSKIEG